jgi:hypothetical protein
LLSAFVGGSENLTLMSFSYKTALTLIGMERFIAVLDACRKKQFSLVLKTIFECESE